MEIDWGAVSASTLILAAIGTPLGFFLRSWIEKGLQHKFDGDLQRTEAGLQAQLEVLRSRLSERDQTVEMLRTATLSGANARHDALHARSVLAIERLWASVIDRLKLKFVASMTVAINMKKSLETASGGGADAENVKRFGEQLWKMFEIDKIENFQSPIKEQIFIPEKIWTVYSAYTSIIALAVAQIGLLRAGGGKDILEKGDKLLLLAKAALPHQTSFLDEHGLDGLPYLLDELYEKLAAEIRQEFDGAPVDRRAVERSQAALSLAEEVLIARISKVDIPNGLRAEMLRSAD